MIGLHRFSNVKILQIITKSAAFSELGIRVTPLRLLLLQDLIKYIIFMICFGYPFLPRNLVIMSNSLFIKTLLEQMLYALFNRHLITFNLVIVQYFVLYQYKLNIIK